MSKTFTYKEENEQGWLVEKPDESKKPGCYVGDETGLLCEACNEYRKYKSTLRRFKYDYQDPGKEMELGKDFEVVDDEIPVNGDYANGTSMVAIPIDVWKEVEDILEYGSNPIEELKSKFIITKK